MQRIHRCQLIGRKNRLITELPLQIARLLVGRTQRRRKIVAGEGLAAILVQTGIVFADKGTSFSNILAYDPFTSHDAPYRNWRHHIIGLCSESFLLRGNLSI